MKKTKQALFHSVIALILCFSMLVGTTFAWFTDEVNSSMNQIVAGNLDVELLANGTKVTDKTELFELEDPNLWEPGMVVYENLTVVNAGTLALKWQMGLNFGNENDLNGHKLSEVLQIAIIDEVMTGTSREDVLAAAKASNTKGALSSFYNYGELAAKTNSETFAVVIFWEPGENDNDYNANNGKETSDKKPLHIEFGIRLQATQMTGEMDSFGSDYDTNAAADFFPGFQGGAGQIPLPLDDQGYTTEEVTYDFGDITVVVPVGVKLAAGYRSLKATVVTKTTSDTNVQLNDTEKMRPSDVHVEGVAADNTTAMFVILRHYLTTGLNSGALTLYHVENGVAVPMKHAANPVNHNEFYYDPLTGDVTLALASFSEVAVVADTNNTWNGNEATEFARGSGTEDDPYLIANADQLAYFRTQVDNGNSFEGKFVKLNNNIYLSGDVNFDPIGWGYVNPKWNRGGIDGNVFQGTFDGNNKIIFDLYQNGWDLKNIDGEAYTYTNCGFGLFAAASNATFKDLTIYGASVTVECVEAGVLVGLSQNSCTYDNIQIINSKIANYQRPAGGLIGEVSGTGTTTIKNVTIGADVVVGSLWGDFDAPCGGVIGARWDDIGANPQIVMENVRVHCRMDVYSDVTSAYQWYAYRRAGMLIGNTELSDPNNKHLAYADFLTCVKDENGDATVEVCYGDWAAYHYCQFENQSDAAGNPSSWNRYPWVRVEAGENCSAYSNPRYGHPVVGGVAVVDDNHECTGGNHHTELRFNQLYGGGQGVYGKADHDGVEVVNYRYSITYVNDSQVLAIKYVTESGAVDTANGAAQDLVEKWAAENLKDYTWEFGGWMNAGSTVLDKIPADNKENIILYPSFNNLYTAMFIDQKGNVLDWMFFTTSQKNELLEKAEKTEAMVPTQDGLVFDYWEVHVTDANGNTIVRQKLADYALDATDIAIYPVYKYANNLRMTPIDTDGDGVTNYYQVDGLSLTTAEYNKLTAEEKKAYMNVTIPAYVNGVEVTHIVADAFSDFADLEVINLPDTITYIGTNAFVKKGEDEQITINYPGTKAEWDDIEGDFASDWDKYIGTGSHIYFSDGSNYEKKGINGIYTYWN